LASADHSPTTNEPIRLPEATGRWLSSTLAVLAAAGLVAGLFLAFLFGSGIESGGGWRRFFLGYLAAFGFVLTIVLGSLFFVMLQHVTRAGWSVNVRRIPEAIAMTLPAMAVLSIPILLTLVFPGESGSPTLYPWAVPGEGVEAPEEPPAEAAAVPGATEGLGRDPMTASSMGLEGPALAELAMDVAHARHHLIYDELTAHKAPYLNRPFFALRIVIYFAIWIAIAAFYWRNSVLQDTTGDPALTTKMQKWAPACLLAFAFSVTGAAFDLWMSLDPHFFSTIWAVYIFAGGVLGSLATIILVYQFLQRDGTLKLGVGREHFHDLGKLLFAFVFFWGYVAFSQFLLIWYANIPETTYWFAVRGATTVDANFAFGAWPSDPAQPAPVGWWSLISLALLFGHLLIPFGGLLSRHVKRNLPFLAFWAVWMLVMHYLDHYWLILPEAMVGGWRQMPVPELATLLFMVGAAGAYFVFILSRVALRPVADPRLHESMAFHNI
jgi:hypothetical protein